MLRNGPTNGPDHGIDGWTYELLGNEFYFVPTRYADCDGICTVGQRCVTNPRAGIEFQPGDLPCEAITSIADAPDLSHVLNFYPNPVSTGTDLTVQVPTELSHVNATLKLFGQLGQLVSERTLPGGAASHTVPLGDLPAGLYYAVWQSAAGRATGRIVVQ